MSTTQTLPPLAAASTAADRPDARRWAPLPVVLAGTFMVILDFFIVNVALPSIQRRLHASDGALEWIVGGYSLTSAIFLIPAGRLGDRFGRRRVFSGSLALFSLASAACGVAATPTQLVLARLVQGAAAALMTPNILSLIGVIYTGADRARAIGAYGTVMGLAAVSGQLIGGGLIAANLAHLAWRSCFLINVPIGAVALLATPRFIPESRDRSAGALDLTGIGLVVALIGAVVLPLLEGRQLHWPAWTWISLAAAPFLFAALVIHQRSAPMGVSRLLDLGLFRHRSFTAGLLAQLCFWAGPGSFFVVLALYLQQGRGLSALGAGLVFTILAVAYLLGSAAAPAAMTRHGRRVVIGGALILASGHAVLLAAVLGFGLHGPILALAPGLLMVGAGMGLVLAPLSTITLIALDPERAGAAAGVASAVQSVGATVGVAVTGAIFFGGLSHGFTHAFAGAVAELCGLLVVVAALAGLLPGRAGRPARTNRSAKSARSLPRR